MTPLLHKFSVTLTAALAALAIFILVYAILLNGVRNGERATRDVEEKIASLKQEEQSARAAGTLLQERRADLARITAFLVPKDNPVVFIETIEDLAKTTGNRLELTLNEGGRREQELAFIALVEGTETSVTRYLRLLELLPYAITLDTVRFERVARDGENSGNRLTFGLRVRTQ